MLNIDFNKYKKIMLVGIGNEFRSDDGVGIYIVKNIKNSKFKKIIAGERLEDYIEEIINYSPDLLVLFDAANINEDFLVFNINDIKTKKAFSTHSLPVDMALFYIKNQISDTEIKIIGIKPYNIDFSNELTDKTKYIANKIIYFFNSIKL